jgi:hypothetical protein
MALTPAPSRQRVLTFLSPNVGDVLFYETKEGHRTNPPAYGTAHPDTTNWPNHKLAFIRQAEEGGAIYHWFYVADRATQNPYNWEFTKADIGGTKFDAVKRTYVTLRSAFTPATPAMGAAMPNTPTDLFTGSYVLAQRQQVRIGDKELDSLFVVDEQVYVKRCTLSVVQDDDETESVLKTESNLYYATEVVPDSSGATATALFADLTLSFWGTSATGVQREGRRISCEWYEITTRQMVPPNTVSAITGTAITAIPIRSYGTTNDFTWPAVFRVASATPANQSLSNANSVVFAAITSADGSYDNIVPRVQLSLPAYRGPTKMTVSEWWRSTALTQSELPTVDVMLPKEMVHVGANYNLRVEPTLHTSITFIDTIGTDDPRFEPNSYSQSFPATNYTDWPTSLVVDVDQVPFRGGYRIRVVTAHQPSQYVAP